MKLTNMEKKLIKLYIDRTEELHTICDTIGNLISKTSMCDTVDYGDLDKLMYLIQDVTGKPVPDEFADLLLNYNATGAIEYLENNF